jgi:hypothetical protein
MPSGKGPPADPGCRRNIFPERIPAISVSRKFFLGPREKRPRKPDFCRRQRESGGTRD